MRIDRLGSLSIRDLQAVLALARHRHFGRAAEECGLTQPSLSALIRRVETAVGKEIFRRSSRRCEITSEGAAVIEVIEQALRDLQALERPLAEERGLSGTVRIGLIPTLSAYLAPHFLPGALQAFPEARFLFTDATTEQLIGLVRADKLDLALLTFPLPDTELAEIPLFEEELVLAAPRNHPAASGARLDLGEVPHEELILLEHGHCLRDHTVQFLGRGDAATAPVHATGLETLRFMVAAGIGCAVFPAMAVHGPLGRTDLVRYVRFRDPVPTRTVGLICKRDRQRLAKAQALADLIRSLSFPSTAAGLEAVEGAEG